MTPPTATLATPVHHLGPSGPELPDPGAPLPASVLEPIAAGIAAGTPLWRPLLSDARTAPVLLVAAPDYEVWLEHGDQRTVAAASHAVAPVDGRAAGIHVYAPRRATVRAGDPPASADPTAGPDPARDPAPRVPAPVVSFALHPARGGRR